MPGALQHHPHRAHHAAERDAVADKEPEAWPAEAGIVKWVLALEILQGQRGLCVDGKDATQALRN